MSRENVEIVRQALERFLAGELLLDTLDEDVEIHDHDIPESGDYRGHEGFLQWLTDWDQAWADWSLELEEVHDAGDRVVAVVRMSATGRASGARINRQVLSSTRCGTVRPSASTTSTTASRRSGQRA